MRGGRVSREFAYNTWANRKTLRSVLAAKAVPARAADVMAHIIGAEWLWLRRLGHSAPEMPVWPGLTPVECDAQARVLSLTWNDFLRSVTEQSLGREVAYTNSKGERWTNTVADVLIHVVVHSAYHRGQIASFLGRAGEASAYTDYIEYVRRRRSEDD